MTLADVLGSNGVVALVTGAFGILAGTMRERATGRAQIEVERARASDASRANAVAACHELVRSVDSYMNTDWRHEPVNRDLSHAIREIAEAASMAELAAPPTTAGAAAAVRVAAAEIPRAADRGGHVLAKAALSRARDKLAESVRDELTSVVERREGRRRHTTK